MDNSAPFKITYLNTINKNLPYIFLDFDYTVSNFGEMKNEIKENCLNLGIGKNIWDKTYADCKNRIGIYNNQQHIKKLVELYPKITQEICDAFYDVFENGIKYKYQDVDEFLEKFNNKYNIILFTLGDEDFQLAKRSSSMIDSYLRAAINTTSSKMESFEYILDNSVFPNLFEIVFVDDKAEYFEKYKRIFMERVSINCKYAFVWINRPNAKYSEIFPSKDIRAEVQEVKDLRDIDYFSYIT